MARNGSGTYNLYTPGNPVVTGTTISSTWANNTLNDIATALTNSIAKDGQTTPTANLPMGTFKFTGLGAGSANGDSLRYEQLVGVYLPLSGGTMTGDIVMSGSTDKWSKGADVASATALPLITDGNYFDVTGTTTITSFNSMGIGTIIGLQFDAALTLTHNATDLILPGGLNILTAAGDEAIFVEYASGDWRCINYTKASGRGIFDITLGTVATTTSGTSHDFTNIPSWVREITINFSGVSTSGTNNMLIIIGDSGGFEVTGYLASAWSTSAGTGVNDTASFPITASIAAATIMHGSVKLSLLDPSTNTWTSNGNIGFSNAPSVQVSAGSKSLSAVLDRVRISTSGGTDTFDAGKINIMYR